MSSAIDLPSLTKAISESCPSGQNLYETVHRQIEQARSPVADANGNARDPDWNKVLQLGGQALETRTKDLQIAAYMTEALGWLYGLDGLRQAFELFRAIQDQFWVSVFPLYEDVDNLGERASPYDFIEDVLPRVLYVAIQVTAAPLTANYNLQQFTKANQTDRERENRNEAIRRTEPGFHHRLSEDLKACRAAFDSWQASTAGHVGRHAPLLENVTGTLDKLDSCLRTIASVRPLVPSPGERGGARAPRELMPQATSEIGRDDPGSISPNQSGESVSAESRRESGGQGAPSRHELDTARTDLSIMASELADSGRLDAAIRLLDEARQSARCRRDRFIRQLELVELCLPRNLTHVARPLLDELAAEQEVRKLEEWEEPGLCARVLMASVACLRASQSVQDQERIAEILQRLYRLDPTCALRGDMMP
jgi:type VI secretion system protein ImpA